MTLTLTDYAGVARWRHAAAKERVNIKPAKSPHWWYLWCDGTETVGICGLIRATAELCRMRGAFILPEWRGVGIGSQMYVARIAAARELGFTTGESFSAAPQMYERLGWSRTGKVLRNGAVHVKGTL